MTRTLVDPGYPDSCKAKTFKDKANNLIDKGWTVRIYVNYDERAKLRANTQNKNLGLNLQTNQLNNVPSIVCLPMPLSHLPYPMGLPLPPHMPMINNNNFTPMDYSKNQNQNM